MYTTDNLFLTSIYDNLKVKTLWINLTFPLGKYGIIYYHGQWQNLQGEDTGAVEPGDWGLGLKPPPPTFLYSFCMGQRVKLYQMFFL